MALDNNPNDLNSAHEREQYFDAVMENPDLTEYDADVISMKLGDSGNEQALYQLKEMADTSSGELGLMHKIERDVDESMARYDGSRSQNLSESAQMGHEVHNLSDMPVARGEDMNPVIAAIYMALGAFGISEGTLNEAMAAGDVDNDRATLEVFHELAEKSGLHELVEYIQGADEVAMHAQLEAGIRDVAPAIGTPEVVAENNMEMQLQPEGLTGPSAPAAPTGPAV